MTQLMLVKPQDHSPRLVSKHPTQVTRVEKYGLIGTILMAVTITIGGLLWAYSI